MWAAGVYADEAQRVERLLRWGALFGPLATSGEPWRFLTATFLHRDLAHVVANAGFLLVLGHYAERIFGHVTFLALALVSSGAAAITVVLAHPLVVVTGASGAVCGVAGALLAFTFHADAATVRWRLRWPIIAFVAWTVLAGRLDGTLSDVAHLTGFVVGLGVGAWERVRRIVLPLGAALVVATALLLPRVIDLEAETAALGRRVDAAVERSDQLVQSWKRDELEDEGFVRALEDDVLPALASTRADLDALRSSSPQLARLRAIIAAREAHLRAAVTLARTGDASTLPRLNQLYDEAERLTKTYRR